MAFFMSSSTEQVQSNTKHDTTFKLAMRDLRIAKEMILAYLPANLVTAIQLNTLAIEHASYIEENLAASHSDMLYSAQLKSSEKSYIYFLWEHQSSYSRYASNVSNVSN